MAEVAGLAFGVLGAFTDAIQCFEYIQLARTFDQDYQTATLKLDVARLRLSRWGASVGLDRVDRTTQSLPGAAGTPADHETAKELLQQIVQLFNVAEIQSDTLKSQPEDSSSSSTNNAARDLDPAASSLHQRLEKLSLKRFRPNVMLKRAKWALYKEKYLSHLIEDTTDLIDGLVNLFPAAQPEQKRLCQDEGAELAADENASLIVPIVEKQDTELSAVIKAQPTRNGGQIFNTSFSGNNYGLQQGYASDTDMITKRIDRHYRELAISGRMLSTLRKWSKVS
ncbi:hypothetical protein LTR51_008644 [Lithohypha guttulata]|nr:hypothetical protein LTR51_008644 [Lithohypha guttulata]